MPERLQRKRTAGWRAPDGALYVGRGSKFGNPWSVRQEDGVWVVAWTGHRQLPEEHGHPHNGAYRVTCAYQATAHEEAVRFYRDWLQRARPDLVKAARTELAGRDLLCWCAADLACHGDALLDLVNTKEAASA